MLKQKKKKKQRMKQHNDPLKTIQNGGQPPFFVASFSANLAFIPLGEPSVYPAWRPAKSPAFIPLGGFH